MVILAEEATSLYAILGNVYTQLGHGKRSTQFCPFVFIHLISSMPVSSLLIQIHCFPYSFNRLET